MHEDRSFCKQCQLTGSTAKGCGYSERYGHTEAAHYKKEADEARSKADKGKAKGIFSKTY